MKGGIGKVRSSAFVRNALSICGIAVPIYSAIPMANFSTFYMNAFRSRGSIRASKCTPIIGHVMKSARTVPGETDRNVKIRTEMNPPRVFLLDCRMLNK